MFNSITVSHFKCDLSIHVSFFFLGGGGGGHYGQLIFDRLRLRLFFYLSHTQLHREYITSSEMYSLHLTHSR